MLIWESAIWQSGYVGEVCSSRTKAAMLGAVDYQPLINLLSTTSSTAVLKLFVSTKHSNFWGNITTCNTFVVLLVCIVNIVYDPQMEFTPRSVQSAEVLL